MKENTNNTKKIMKTKNQFTLYKGRFGYSITDEINHITYCERNRTESSEFNKLYAKLFAKQYGHKNPILQTKGRKDKRN